LPSSTRRKPNGGRNRRGASSKPLRDRGPSRHAEELDELYPDEAIRQIKIVIENNTQLCVAAEDGIVSWGQMAVARVKARAKAKPKNRRLTGKNDKAALA
jgi:hypothetical protein